jgi:hypothetical protein
MHNTEYCWRHRQFVKRGIRQRSIKPTISVSIVQNFWNCLRIAGARPSFLQLWRRRLWLLGTYMQSAPCRVQIDINISRNSERFRKNQKIAFQNLSWKKILFAAGICKINPRIITAKKKERPDWTSVQKFCDKLKQLCYLTLRYFTRYETCVCWCGAETCVCTHISIQTLPYIYFGAVNSESFRNVCLYAHLNTDAALHIFRRCKFWVICNIIIIIMIIIHRNKNRPSGFRSPPETRFFLRSSDRAS